jgi:hypothetical protein
MTKPIADRFKDQYPTKLLPTTLHQAFYVWLQAQAENKQPLFTLAEVEQILKEANKNIEFLDDTKIPIISAKWWKQKKQLLEKQEKS